MTRKELRELIRSVIREYTGTGAMTSTGLTSYSGNNVPSPRPFHNDEDEIENYANKNVYGGQGRQTTGMEKTQRVGNPNRTRFTRF